MKLMKIVGSADGRLSEFDCSYLAEIEFDIEQDGVKLLVTRSPDVAMKFADAKAVLELWRTQSKAVPRRPDGKPNRPLTAFTIEVVDAPADDQVSRTFERMSPISGDMNSLTLLATADQWAAYDRGELIQRALPHLSDGEREFIMTGITDEEWDKAFPDEEDEADAGQPDRPDSR